MNGFKGDGVRGGQACASAAPPNQPTQAESTGRLRGSCEPCAKSKVKCGKEKPTCDRCKSRGTECIYLISRRPGRVPGANSRRHHARVKSDRDSDSGTSSSAYRGLTPPGDHAHHRSSSDLYSGVLVNRTSSPTLSATGSESTNNEPGLVPSRTNSFMSTPNMEYPQNYCLDSNFNPNSFDLLLSLDDGMYSTLMDLEESLGSASSWPSDGENSTTQGDMFAGQGPIDYSLARQSTNPDLASISPRQSIMPSSSSALDFSQMVDTSTFPLDTDNVMPLDGLVDPAANLTPTGILNEPCDCVAQALDILKTVSRPQPRPRFGNDRANSAGNILAQNKHSVDKTATLMACSACKDDRFLLMVILMIAMKLLERYACVTASRGPTEFKQNQVGINASSHGYSAMDVDSLHGEEQPAPRESMQSVLRELIHVQKLISLLPSRLRSIRCSSAHDTMSGLEVDQAMSSGMAGWSLSARALSLVDDDVRANLKALSANIRSGLRNS